MTFYKLLKTSWLFLFFLGGSYLIANMLWFTFVDGKLFVETDRIFPLTDFLPPYIHDCCGDNFASGWNEEKVTIVGYLFIGGMILFSFVIALMLSNLAQLFRGKHGTTPT